MLNSKFDNPINIKPVVSTVYQVIIDIAKKEDKTPINLYLTYNAFGTQSWDSNIGKAHCFPNIMEAIDALDKSNITMRIGEYVKSVVIMGLETKASIVRSWIDYGGDIKTEKGEKL